MRERNKEKRTTSEYKRKRVYKQNVKSRDELLAERCSDPKVGTYSSGVALTIETKNIEGLNVAQVTPEQKKRRMK